MTTHRGVYFLANDRVIELAIAFLNSFRHYNPTIPLCLIPYASDLQEISKLAEKYKFSIFSDQEILRECDRSSECIHGRIYGEFRKQSAWMGEFDQFFYIDIDTVVLQNIEFAFSFLSDYAFVASQSNTPGLTSFVWKKSIHSANTLTNEQIEFSANMGCFASRRGAVTLEDIADRLLSARPLIPHMALDYPDQGWLNYLVTTTCDRYTSLGVLRDKLGDSVPGEVWAGGKGASVRNGRIIYQGTELKNIFLVHWAGEWQPKECEWAAYHEAIAAGLEAPRPVIGASMPYREFWNAFRYLEDCELESLLRELY